LTGYVTHARIDIALAAWTPHAKDGGLRTEWDSYSNPNNKISGLGHRIISFCCPKD
jgi:hypothetical protein